MRVLGALVFAVVASAPRSPGAAETLGVLAVAPPPGPSPELVEATARLRQVMAGRSRAVVLDARQLGDRMTGESGGASLAELDRAFEGARNAAVSGDYEGSAKTLRAIVEEIEKLPSSDAAFQQWTRAMLRLAKTEADLGRAETSRGVLDRLVRAAPDVKVDVALYPPRFAKQVEDARAQLAAVPKRKLTVTSSAKGVRVFVNGRDVGAAPVSVALARGHYQVSGAIGQLRAPLARVELTEADQSVVLDFTVPEALRPALGPGLALPETDRDRGIVAAGGFLGLDSILSASFTDEAGVSFLVGSLYDVRRGMKKRVGQVRLGANRSLPAESADDLADFLVTGRPTKRVEDRTQGVAPAKPPIDARPPYKEKTVHTETRPSPARSAPLGWAALGSTLAAAGLGGVAVWQGFKAKGSYDDANKLRNPDGTVPSGSQSAYRSLVRDGDSAKQLATVLGATAGVCAVTSGILYYLYARSDEPPAPAATR